MSFCLAGLAQLQQRLKEQLVLCQPRTALEGVALHDKVQVCLVVFFREVWNKTGKSRKIAISTVCYG